MSSLRTIAAWWCVVVLLCGLACEFPPHVEPDFVLLLSDSGHYRFDPIVSPDGRFVYYLDDTTWAHGAFPDLALRGGLRVFGIGDSTDRLLLPGRFYGLALSPDGQKLAVVADSPVGQRTFSRLFVFDTAAAHVDSLVVSHAETDLSVCDMHFFHNGTALLYCIRPDMYHTNDFRFYSVSLQPGSRETLLFQFPGYLDGFDVFDGDSMYVDSLIRDDPAVNPAHTRWVAYTYSHDGVLMLKDRSTGSVRRMGNGTRPRKRAFVEYPKWAPNGNELFFSSGQPDADRVEIWSLKNAGDYLTCGE